MENLLELERVRSSKNFQCPNVLAVVQSVFKRRVSAVEHRLSGAVVSLWWWRMMITMINQSIKKNYFEWPKWHITSLRGPIIWWWWRRRCLQCLHVQHDPVICSSSWNSEKLFRSFKICWSYYQHKLSRCYGPSYIIELLCLRKSFMISILSALCVMLYDDNQL